MNRTVCLVAFLLSPLFAGCDASKPEPAPAPLAPSPAAPVKAAAPAAGFRLGFWNIRDLGRASRDERELSLIAQVASGVECLAVAEVNDDAVLGDLTDRLTRLGGAWGLVQTPDKVGNSAGSREHYGVLYRSDLLRVRGRPYVLPEAVCPDPGGSDGHVFDREPFVASFATLDGRLDFTVVVVHVVWGDRAVDRIAEVWQLARYYLEVQAADPEDDDVFLCGDFNRDAGDVEAFGRLLAIPTMFDSGRADEPTSVTSNSTYDHILFQLSHVREYLGRRGVERFDETLFGGDSAAAKQACSDHRMVWVEVGIPDRDDDGTGAPSAPGPTLPGIAGRPDAGRSPPAPAPVAGESELVYITETGAKYHAAGCRHLGQSKIAIPIERARESYEPCGHCRPQR